MGVRDVSRIGARGRLLPMDLSDRSSSRVVVRPAVVADASDLATLRRQMFSDMLGSSAARGTGAVGTDREWFAAAVSWFAAAVDEPDVCIRVAVEDGTVLAAAMGELHLGAPAPSSPTGRKVHVSNVVTAPHARRRGLARRCLTEVLRWADEIARADRVELHATSQGRELYSQLGFVASDNLSMRRSTSTGAPNGA